MKRVKGIANEVRRGFLFRRSWAIEMGKEKGRDAREKVTTNGKGLLENDLVLGNQPVSWERQFFFSRLSRLGYASRRIECIVAASR